MSAYLELMIQGGRLALVDAGSVSAVIMPKNGDSSTPGTPDDGLIIALKGGDQMPPMYGFSAEELMVAMAYVLAMRKAHAMPVAILKWRDFHERVAQAKAAATGSEAM